MIRRQGRRWYVWILNNKGNYRLVQERRNKRGFRGKRPPRAAYKLRNRQDDDKKAIIRDHKPDQRVVVPDISVIPRSVWGGSDRTGGRKVDWGRETEAILHHTVGPFLTGVEAERRYMRQIERQHQAQGWATIGYHFVVFPSGRVYRGRRPETGGAHCPGKNHLPGIALAGNFVSKKPTLQQVDAVRRLQKMLKKPNLGMHREYYATACPGDKAVAVFDRA